MSTDIKPPRAVLTGVQASFFGSISLIVDLLPMKQPEIESFKTVCPTCPEPIGLKEQLCCPEGHGPFTRSDVGRALEVDKDTLARVTDEQIASVRESGVGDCEATFSVHPAAQVESVTMPGLSMYRLRPHVPGRRAGGVRKESSAGATRSYALVLNLVADTNVAFVAELKNRGATKMYRLIGRDGMLTLVELVRPGEIREPVAYDTDCDPAVVAKAQELIECSLTDFNPEQWRDGQRERIEALRSTLLNTDVAETEETPTLTPVADDSLLSQLEASLVATKRASKRAARKAVAKKAPVKVGLKRAPRPRKAA